MDRRTIASCVLVLGTLPCCSRSEAGTQGGEPSVSSQARASLSLSIEVDGARTIVIDEARLEAVPPDARDGALRVWRLKSLAGEDVYPGRTTAIEIQQQGGTRHPLIDSADVEAAREPMVAVDGAGAMRLALIRADEKFPPFEDPRALAGVERVWVDTKAATPEVRPPSEATAVRLAVTVGGRVSSWGRADFDRVQPLGYTTKEDEARDAWSLRELARALVGPHARVVAVEGEGKRVEISKARWLDPSGVPALRITRRGLVKLQWLTHEGKPASQTGVEPIELRGVTAISVIDEPGAP